MQSNALPSPSHVLTPQQTTSMRSLHGVAATLARASSAAHGSISMAVTVTSGRRCAAMMATMPVPVPMSSTRPLSGSVAAVPAMHGCGRGGCERCVIVPPHQTFLLVVAVAVLWMIVAMTGRAAAV